jgi:hypothetical protein
VQAQGPLPLPLVTTVSAVGYLLENPEHPEVLAAESAAVTIRWCVA